MSINIVAHKGISISAIQLVYVNMPRMGYCEGARWSITAAANIASAFNNLQFPLNPLSDTWTCSPSAKAVNLTVPLTTPLALSKVATAADWPEIYAFKASLNFAPAMVLVFVNWINDTISYSTFDNSQLLSVHASMQALDWNVIKHNASTETHRLQSYTYYMRLQRCKTAPRLRSPAFFQSKVSREF